MLSSDNCALDQTPMLSTDSKGSNAEASRLKSQIVQLAKENDKLNIDVNVKSNEITKLNS